MRQSKYLLLTVILLLLKQLLITVDFNLTTDSKKAWLYVPYQKQHYLQILELHHAEIVIFQ